MKNRVRKVRKNKNISPEQLAKEANVSVSMIYQIEREEKNPSLAVAQRISQTFFEESIVVDMIVLLKAITYKYI